MSQQLQITGGAKVRDLQDVIIGTSGVLSSLAFNVANGVPKLDVNGKILVSQLPNSVMEYQGTWNAATNTPTLVNGTGNQGDVYLCNVAGTTNFGAGPITFAVGDSAIYSGTIWQRAGGATGSVTSVGLSSTGNDAITITGSPVTTSGTINLGFAGTNLQYINGAGDLTTFPTLISSIGLTMPSAFSVANSPLTSNGTIAVTGAGFPSQYIRGDGTLADFPTSGGGGSSVSYYLNGGTSQGVIGGITYYEMSKIAVIGTGVDFPKTGDGLIVSFLTDAGDPAQLNIPAGNWNYEIYASMSANGGTPQLYAELYVYDGTTFTLIATSTNEILYDGTTLNLYTFAMAVPATTLALTDRLAVKLYATNSGGKTTTVHTQDGHLCQIITTFSTGITALNGLTTQVQFFATGTSGTDFNISSATATHTFNLPVASAANTGKLSSTDWSTFNGKVPYTGATGAVNLGVYKLTAAAIEITGGTGTAGNLTFGQSDTFAIPSANNSSIDAITTSFSFAVTAADSSYKYFNFQTTSLTNNTLRSYTLPDASGTLALTSNLSSYLPLTGGTLTGQLYINPTNTATVGLDVASNTTRFRSDNLEGFKRQLEITMGSGTLVQCVAKGFGGTYGTDLAFYTSSAGGVNGSPAMYITGGNNIGIGTGLPSATLDVVGTGNFSGVLKVSAATGFAVGSIAGYRRIEYSGTTFSMLTNADVFANLNAGTATFTTDSYFATTSGSVGIGSTTIYNSAGFNRVLSIYESGSVAISLATSLKQYQIGITGTDSDYRIYDGTNLAYRFAINGSTGYIAINNLTPAYQLDVSGSLRNTTSAYFATSSGAVGIGTTSTGSGSSLDIVGQSSASNSFGILTIRNSSNGGISIGASSSSYTWIQSNIYGTGGLPPLALNPTGGNVGIGSNDAGALLVLRSTVAGSSNFAWLTFRNGASGFGTWGFYKSSNNNFSLAYATDTDTPMTNATSVTFLYGGSVNFNSLGTGAVTATGGTLSTTSDMNLKIEDGYIDNALDKVLKLTPRYFLWKEESGLPTDLRQLGFYAQEVNEVLGEEVANTPKDDNDKWGIYDRGIIAMLTKAMQEQNELIEDLKARLDNAGL